MGEAPIIVGILNGSFRQNGNGRGVADWVSSRFENTIVSNAQFQHILLKQLSSETLTILPLGPIVEDEIAQGVQRSDDYISPATREWSRLVTSLSALIIVTPQYNWGIPGELKNAIDHLYAEWTGLPITIISYGGAQGGAKCQAQLRQVLGGACKASLVAHDDEIAIKLPPNNYIRGAARVQPDPDGEDVFLKEYEAVTDSLLRRTAEAALVGRVEPQPRQHTDAHSKQARTSR